MYLVARSDAVRNAAEATATTPAPPATDQNKMLAPDHAPAWLLLLVVALPLSLPPLSMLPAKSEASGKN